MNEKVLEFINELNIEELSEGIASDRRDKSIEVQKVKFRQIEIKGEKLYQVTEYIEKQVKHKNLVAEEFKNYLADILSNNYKQANITTTKAVYSILISKKGQVTVKKKMAEKPLILMHNREKQYLLKEGQPVDFLVALGVMNDEGYVTKHRYDKFRQINRFLEFVEDIVYKLPNDKTIKIIDFGCGKSYLTFAIYYFLKEKKGLDVNIIGLDLKKEVIKNCNELAEKLNYTNLKFLMGDIADYELQDDVDMVVTLHACDTATDYALYKAIRWNAKVILSVPCCQHEVNGQIANDVLSPLLKYGILKERMSALITDAVRGETLKEQGYDAQILEFIDMEHTPKNLLIRAVKKDKYTYKKDEQLEKMVEELSIKPTLRELLK